MTARERFEVGDSVDPGLLLGRRWFAAPARPIGRVVVVQRVSFPGGGALAILRADVEGGSPLWVTMPVGTESEFWAGLLDLAVPGRSSRTPARLGPAVRPLGVDQSHTSFVVDEAFVVKLYRMLAPGPNPEVELAMALAGRADTPVPSFAGSFAVRTPAGTRFDVAIVQRFISGAVDEFETLADRLAAWLRAGADEADGTELLTEVGAVGRTVARLHVGLGGLTGRGLRPREATPADRSAWRRRARRALAEGLRSVSAMDPELAARLEGRRPELEQALGPLLGLDDRGGRNPWLTRIHGDLHVGQLIRDRSADGRFLVVDLEGEPTRTAAERRRVDLPLRDIASMLRAYDHIGRSAIRRAGSAMPGSHTSVVDAWLARARTTFLDAYRAGRSAAGLEPELDPAMLHALEVEKELYEFAYAARYLPDWRYAPAAGLGWLLETRHG